jgi:DNA polymerase-3 subunit gamma/tau
VYDERAEVRLSPFVLFLEDYMLALKYRPTNFNDVIGQKSVNVFLAHMTAKKNLPNLMIFDGVHGSGKTSSARIIGAAMHCEKPPVPCGTCYSCRDIFDGISLSVTEIDAASHGKVADMEALREELNYSNGADGRLVILDEAHAISREGFKSMLKTFEEAPTGVKFILVTTEFRKIPETIVSRAMRFTFNRVPLPDIISRLNYVNTQEALGFEQDLVTTIADKSNGSVRDAIMLADKLSRVGIKTVSDYVISTGDTDFGPILLNAMLASGPAGAIKVVTKELNSSGDAEVVPESLSNLFKDLLLLKSGMPIQRQGSSLEVRKELAAKVSNVQIMNSLRTIWDLKTKIQHSEAYYEAYLAVTMVAEVFYKQVFEPTTFQPTAQAEKLSLSDLANI